jgi:hypothetical protein
MSQIESFRKTEVFSFYTVEGESNKMARRFVRVKMLLRTGDSRDAYSAVETRKDVRVGYIKKLPAEAESLLI